MTRLNEFGLSNWTMTDLRTVFSHHPDIKKVILFGSRAKGNYRTGSDIDLALVGDKPIEHKELIQIYNDIDDLGLLYGIDLVDYTKNKGKPIGDHIDRTGKMFFQRN